MRELGRPTHTLRASRRAHDGGGERDDAQVSSKRSPGRRIHEVEAAPRRSATGLTSAWHEACSGSALVECATPWMFLTACWLLATVACQPDEPPSLRPAPRGTAFSVKIHEPPELTSLATERTDNRGRPLRVACTDCHSLRPEEPVPESPASLRDFHVGLEFSHGELACRQCHAAGQPPVLHLAGGERVELQDAMRLCAQCHGPQYRDYRRGSHGGSNGHWDLRQGERVRNHCVDCHEPHAPAIGQVQPAPPPADRFFGANRRADPHKAHGASDSEQGAQ